LCRGAERSRKEATAQEGAETPQEVIPRRLRDRALADVGDLPAPRYYRLKLK
jgi:hypothetical protein